MFLPIPREADRLDITAALCAAACIVMTLAGFGAGLLLGGL